MIHNLLLVEPDPHCVVRGVIFAVGHGPGSFHWDVAEGTLRQGIEPQTISTDLHVYNAEVIRMPGEIGTLLVGAWGGRSRLYPR